MNRTCMSGLDWVRRVPDLGQQTLPLSVDTDHEGLLSVVVVDFNHRHNSQNHPQYPASPHSKLGTQNKEKISCNFLKLLQSHKTYVRF